MNVGTIQSGPYGQNKWTRGTTLYWARPVGVLSRIVVPASRHRAPGPDSSIVVPASIIKSNNRLCNYLVSYGHSGLSVCVFVCSLIKQDFDGRLYD
jgi:hypothetical protein